MREVAGVWIPARDEFLAKKLEGSPKFPHDPERGTYQVRKLFRAMSLVANFRHAVDVGAHVGLWSMQMARYFRRVTAFEPVPHHQECFMRNMRGGLVGSGIYLVGLALGDRDGDVSMVEGLTTSLKTRVSGLPARSVGRLPTKPARVTTLDSRELTDVDLLKIDVEGYEWHVVQGAGETIKRCRPVVVVEQKPGVSMRYYGIPDTAAVQALVDLNYRMDSNMNGDYVMVPT